MLILNVARVFHANFEFYFGSLWLIVCGQHARRLARNSIQIWVVEHPKMGTFILQNSTTKSEGGLVCCIIHKFSKAGLGNALIFHALRRVVRPDSFIYAPQMLDVK